jgi:hypothetical protein
MSYIVRSGRLLSAAPLAGEPGSEYVHIRVEVSDRYWDEDEPEMDAETIYSVMVLGDAAVHISAIAKAGSSPTIVFAGRYIIRRLLDGAGKRQISHEVIGDHVGVHLGDPMFAHGPDDA